MEIRIAWQLLTGYFKQIDLIWWAIFLMMLAISLAVFIVYRRKGGTHKSTGFWCVLIPYSLLIFAATIFSMARLEEQYWTSIINLDITTAWWAQR